MPDHNNIFNNQGVSDSIVKRHEDILDNLSEIVIVTNSLNEIVFVNKQFLNTFQYTTFEILNKPFDVLLQGEIILSSAEFSESRSEIKKLPLITSEGKALDLYIYTYPLKDSEGTFIGHYYTSVNIKNENIISRVSSIIDFFKVNHSVYLKIDKQLNVLEHINGIPEEIFTSEETLIGKKLPEIIPLEFSKKILKSINDIIKNETSTTIELKIKANGKLFQAGIGPSPDGNLVIIFQHGLGNLLSRESIRKTESRFRLIWEKSIDGMRLLDSSGRMAALNPSFCRIVEMDMKDLIGKKYYEVYDSSKDDVNNLEQEYLRKFETRSFDDFFITKLRLKTGRYVYLEVSNNFIDSYQEDLDLFEGEILLFSILRDITDRKLAEDKVRDREELYRSLIETSPDSVCLYIPDGQIITCNQQTAELFGFVNLNEMLEYKDNFYDYFSKSTKKSAFEDSRKILEYGHLNNMEYEFIRFDGSYFYGELCSSVIFNRANHPRAIVSVLRNITERKLASEKIKRSELLFRSVWENSKDGMSLTDSEGIIKEVNAAYCEMFEMKSEELIGKNVLAAYKFRNKDDYDRKLNKYKQDFEHRNYKSKYNSLTELVNGRKLIVDSSFSFVESQSQEVLLLSVLRDVTEQRSIEEKLNQEAKLATIGKMALYLTHEMKTPLSTIKLSVDILTQSIQCDEQQTKSFHILKKEIKRLERLLKSVLQFSKATELNISEIDLQIMIGNIHEILTPVLVEKNIVFINRVGSLRIEGDYQKLFSALLQIIENSVEAINYSGTIDISSEIEPDGNVKLFIRDDGSGIEEKEKIFNPFYTTKNTGTGLGLAIAKNIIEHHNGSIKLHSSKPGETIFEVLFSVGN